MTFAKACACVRAGSRACSDVARHLSRPLPERRGVWCKHVTAYSSDDAKARPGYSATRASALVLTSLRHQQTRPVCVCGLPCVRECVWPPRPCKTRPQVSEVASGQPQARTMHHAHHLVSPELSAAVQGGSLHARSHPPLPFTARLLTCCLVPDQLAAGPAFFFGGGGEGGRTKGR